jgi:hypothetical protein
MALSATASCRAHKEKGVTDFPVTPLLFSLFSSTLCHLASLLLADSSVSHLDPSTGDAGETRVVSHHHDRYPAFPIQFLEHLGISCDLWLSRFPVGSSGSRISGA